MVAIATALKSGHSFAADAARVLSFPDKEYTHHVLNVFTGLIRN